MALYQDPIDLLLKGTAKEWPISEDVIQRLALIGDSFEGSASNGFLYAAFRDRPVSALIEVVYSTGYLVLTEAQGAALSSAADLMGVALLRDPLCPGRDRTAGPGGGIYRVPNQGRILRSDPGPPRVDHAPMGASPRQLNRRVVRVKVARVRIGAIPKVGWFRRILNAFRRPRK